MDFALVIPFLEDGSVQLIRQYKHGPRCQVLGFPTGHVDPGEESEPAARRALMEETGLEPGELIHLGSYVDHGNQRVCTGHYFAARGAGGLWRPIPAILASSPMKR